MTQFNNGIPVNPPVTNYPYNYVIEQGTPTTGNSLLFDGTKWVPQPAATYTTVDGGSA